ncbi:doubled motif LPXTG anchor domain-containing protein [Lachnospiraceae bacterium 62-35]
MERQKKARLRKRHKFSIRRRVMSCMLAAAMIFTNVSADLGIAFASESNQVDFEIQGSDLVAAIEEAIANDAEITKEELDFTNGDKIDKFEELFFDEGKVYEIFPEVEGEDTDAEVRLFVRVPENADDTYVLTGEEEIIFLYINNGDETVSCSTSILRTEKGKERVKRTRRVTVKAFEDAFGDEEIEVFTKPAVTEEKTESKEENENKAEVPKEEVNVPGEEAGGEIQAPEENQDETQVPEEDDIEAPEDKNEAQAPEDETQVSKDGNEDETQASEKEEDEVQASKDENEDEIQASKDEDQDEADSPDREESESKDEEKAEENEDGAESVGENAENLEAAVSRHAAPLVAIGGEGEAEENEPKKETAEAVREAEEKKPVETEEKVEEIKEKEEAEDKTVEEVKEKETAEDKVEETTEAEESVKEDESTEASSEESEKETAKAEESSENNEENPEEETKNEEINPEETTAPSEENQETEITEEVPSLEDKETKAPAEEIKTEEKDTKVEDSDEDDTEKKGKPGISDLVGIGNCSTGKVYTATLDSLKALDDVSGFEVSYNIYPEDSAELVKSMDSVEEGEALEFTVKNQTGYIVESVLVNGETVEADNVIEHDNGLKSFQYVILDVQEEQEVEINMEEAGEYPAFEEELAMKDGTVIRLSAEEGVLPEGVKAVAEVVTGVEDVIKEKITTEAAENGEVKEVVAALTYNIDLLDAEGNKLDNEVWNGSVQVTFSGPLIEEYSKGVNTVEVMYVETSKEDTPQARITAEDVVSVETISDSLSVSEEEAIGEIGFDAEHFSVYSNVFSRSSFDGMEARVDATGYPTLKEAVEAAESGDTITLLQSVSLDETIAIDKDITLTAEDGAEISRKKVVKGKSKYVYTIFEIKAGGKLTLREIAFTGDSGAEMDTGSSPIVCYGSLVIEEGTKISGFKAKTGGALTIESSGDATMYGGEISDNTVYEQWNAAGKGGGIYIKGGSLTIKDGEVKNNSMVSESYGRKGVQGGGICNEGGTLIIDSGKVCENKAGTERTSMVGDGGGIYIGSGGSFTMNGGEISGNAAMKKGGGICIGTDGYKVGSIQIIAGTIQGNRADTGGGIYMSQSNTLSLKEVAIAENNSVKDGGGIWSCSTGKGRIYATRGGYISRNSAERRGGDFVSQRLFGEPHHLAERLYNGEKVDWYQDRGQWFVSELGDNVIPNINMYLVQWSNEGGWDDLGIRNQTMSGYEEDEYYHLFITNNTAESFGGGIACNGTLIIGEENQDMDIRVEKAWVDESGTPITNDGDHPESISVTLVNEDTGKELETVELNKENEWSHDFLSLPKGNYTVKEESIDGWAGTVERKSSDEGYDYILAITNKPHTETSTDPEDDSSTTEKDTTEKETTEKTTESTTELTTESTTETTTESTTETTTESTTEKTTESTTESTTETTTESTTESTTETTTESTTESTTETTTTDIPRRPSGGGDGGGGGGGGSSSPSPTPDPETVTITPDDVPLANLPEESPMENPVIILEDDVPLGALPKTGDKGSSSDRLLGTMILTLVAAYGVTKKRKEE